MRLLVRELGNVFLLTFRVGRREMKRSWIVEKAEVNGKLIGVKINLMIDNGPIRKCFEKVEALRNGTPFEEKTAREILYDDVIASSERMQRFL